MKPLLFSVLTLTALLAGCAPGYYETPQETSQQGSGQQFFTNPYTNPETEQEYRRRIWWENYESEWPRFHHRWR